MRLEFLCFVSQSRILEYIIPIFIHPNRKRTPLILVPYPPLQRSGQRFSGDRFWIVPSFQEIKRFVSVKYKDVAARIVQFMLDAGVGVASSA